MNTAHDAILGWVKDTFPSIVYDNIYSSIVRVFNNGCCSTIEFYDIFIIVNNIKYYHNSPTFFDDVYNEIKKQKIDMVFDYD